MSDTIDTDRYSARLRPMAVRVSERKLLVANIGASSQANDLSNPANCRGFGRIRHFTRRHSDWPHNPLPIDPAIKALGLEAEDELQAQVFQNAACNWRCWYCYVPFRLLEAREEAGAWFSAEGLLELYLNEPVETRPKMIDLTGGQPELVPEWVPWMMSAMRARNLEGDIYLWSDDNLSNDYFWRYLTEAQQELVATFQGYGRVACFKGFDARSFAFNTRAAEELFDRQFEIFGRLLATGMDLYAYATFTAETDIGIDDAIKHFVDRLQRIHENLPLRTVPLKVVRFPVVQARLSRSPRRLATLANEAELHQMKAVEAWLRELDARFPSSLRETAITDISMAP